MKELRIQCKKKVIRILFAFDPHRDIILLVGDDKKGKKTFYQTMIPIADNLLVEHTEKLRKEDEKNKEK